MADDLPVEEPEDPGDVAEEDPGDAFGGLPDLVQNLRTVNELLDQMVIKLGNVSKSLDEVLAKLAQIDTQSSGGGGDTSQGSTPGSEGD